jgi:hypothetical protein
MGSDRLSVPFLSTKVLKIDILVGLIELKPAKSLKICNYFKKVWTDIHVHAKVELIKAL